LLRPMGVRTPVPDAVPVTPGTASSESPAAVA
jgi:hypothetical protein